MALPSNILTALNNIYDDVQNSEYKMTYRKVTIGPNTYKVRIYAAPNPEASNRGCEYLIEIIKK